MNRCNFAVWLLSTCLSLLVVGCDTPINAVSGSETNATVGSRLISDQAHHQGTRGFLFLPPLVPPPANYGEFVPGLPVTVRIDELNATGRVVRTLSTFTATSGPNGERLRTHFQDTVVEDNDWDEDPVGYYYARWLTHDAQLSPSARYRVRVLVPAKGGQHRELGFVDIDLVRTAREFRRVDTQEFSPLINGTTLRIKFRVDRQAVDEDSDGAYDWLDNCPSVPNTDQLDSLANGVGDACRCLRIRCPTRDACHEPGQCDQATGQCSETPSPDGKPCAIAHGDAICVDGNCELQSCHAHYSDCNGSATDGCETTLTSNDNCGGCGLACPDSPDGRVSCRSGECVLRCPAGTSDCDADLATGCETNTRSDPTACGACGNHCPDQKACIHGGCSSRACQPDWANCDRIEDNGCEVNISEDARNCGACHHDCGSLPNAIAACSGGECQIGSCAEGFGDCNGSVDDGCEVDLLNETNHCGACGSRCAPLNASGTCNAGTCAIANCSPNFANCDGLVDNGCETHTDLDVNNCGACGAMCQVVNGSPQCSGGKCQIGTCDVDTADCNGARADGCETQLRVDALNCGACGSICPAAQNARGLCSAGSCIQTCNPGFANCDGDPSNGCEVDVSGNCGLCGHVCDLPHATGNCVAGACEFSTCQPGYADCDGLASNGCEVELNSDASHCGACGARCMPGALCTDGACRCTSDFLTCASPTAGGGYSCCPKWMSICTPSGTCQVINFDTDVNNCGAVGHICASGQLCISRVCKWPASPGGGQTNDNCGKDHRVCPPATTCIPGASVCAQDPNNCGGSGIVCPSGTICFAGTCTCLTMGTVLSPSCHGQCNIAYSSDPNNCGSCGNVCPVGTSCADGHCV